MVDMTIAKMLIVGGIMASVACAVVSHLSSMDDNKRLAKISYVASTTLLAASCLGSVAVAITIIIHLMMR